jgi:hypothetical protein
MRIFFRLSVCAVLIGFLGAVYSVLFNGTIDFSDSVLLNISIVQRIFFLSIPLLTVFFCRLCSFGWLVVLPILFYRSYSLSLVVVSAVLGNIEEATAILPSLLVSFLFEIGSLLFFSPVAAEFSLSIIKSSDISFGRRFFEYILFLIVSISFVCLSILVKIMI